MSKTPAEQRPARLPKAKGSSRLPLEGHALGEAYLDARTAVLDAGFGHEIDWQDSRKIAAITESVFLREAAWVVLSTGMAERVVRQLFDSFSDAFLHWHSADDIVSNRDRCIANALDVFGHRGKVNAIFSIAEMIHQVKFQIFRGLLERCGFEILMEMSYFGPASSLHLAKNLGIDVVKPDRHLLRAASAAGAASPVELCQAISDLTGDRLSTVDLVFWRFGAMGGDYAGLFDRWRDR